MPRKSSALTVTDLFCGAGGSAQGALAAGAEIVIAANHWKRAIETYDRNLGQRVRIIECVDISASDPRRYPSTRIGIMTAECTTHSPAGGNRRRRSPQRDLFVPDVPDPSLVRSRVTMWDVVRFAEYHQYDAILTENVVEAATLWPLFPDWLRAMGTLGYEHTIVSLNSMFCLPTPQSRDRIYVVFWRKGNRPPDLDIRPWAPCPKCVTNVRARQTWKNGRTIGKYRRQYVYTCPSCRQIVEPYYFAALNAIDFSIPAERIGDRQKPLRPRTLERIRYGLDKYGRRVLVINVMQGERDSSRAWPADLRPLGSVPTWDDYFAIAAPVIVNAGSNEEMQTLAASNRPGLVLPFLVETAQSDSQRRRPRATDEPMPAMTAQLSTALIGPGFMPFVSMQRTQPQASATDAALPTVCTSEGHHMLVQGAALISLRDANAMHVGDLSEPTMTQIAAPQSALISRAPFLVQHYGTNNASPIDRAMPVVTTIDRHELIGPTPELTVDDCYFRMLQPNEIGRAMAFGDDYEVLGNKRDKVRQYGNAVTPPAMEELFRRVAQSLEPEVEYDSA